MFRRILIIFLQISVKFVLLQKIYLRRHEAQYEQINTGGDYSQTKQDKDQTQNYISRFIGKRLIILQSNLFINLTASLARASR